MKDRITLPRITSPRNTDVLLVYESTAFPHTYSLNAGQATDWQPFYPLSDSAVSFLRWGEGAAYEVCRTSDDFDNLINPDPATATLLLRRGKDWPDTFLEVLWRDSDSLESTADAIVGIVRQRLLPHTPE